MKLDDVKASNIEVRSGGGGGKLPGGKGAKAGIGGVLMALVIAVVSQMGGGGGGGGDALGQVLGQLSGGGTVSGEVPETDGSSLQGSQKFVGQMITLLNQYWEPVFEGSEAKFAEPGQVVFTGPTQTGGCGTAQPSFGPFYCPADSKIYIDLDYYQQLEQQLGFEGDFAMAYVMAHEYGHHVQNLLGIDDQVRQQQNGASQAESNALSVKVELQADCFAGAWGRSAEEAGRLEAGDFEEAMGAASAVGDDSIQGANANQESFTHGTAAQRQQWFRTGYDSGDPSRCDTFA